MEIRLTPDKRTLEQALIDVLSTEGCLVCEKKPKRTILYYPDDRALNLTDLAKKLVTRLRSL